MDECSHCGDPLYEDDCECGLCGHCHGAACEFTEVEASDAFDSDEFGEDPEAEYDRRFNT